MRRWKNRDRVLVFHPALNPLAGRDRQPEHAIIIILPFVRIFAFAVRSRTG
jgi:hypothetical protein